MPNSRESYKEFLREVHEYWKKQEECTHEFKKPAHGLSEHYEQQCSKCL